ncbi:hypothetical protein Y032_0071g575 [Ancylostoma ceylanicum]|uniref:Secreted protein n=1 Tax=Ancylostoma ceylanicum TaxID=53326 RepID=A0A016TY58_9BILA|nr:hypothetical protein Y032_0071g575 [Ancylostoma ceylanicum]
MFPLLGLTRHFFLFFLRLVAECQYWHVKSLEITLTPTSTFYHAEVKHTEKKWSLDSRSALCDCESMRACSNHAPSKTRKNKINKSVTIMQNGYQIRDQRVRFRYLAHFDLV